jgi:two-component system, OmpR family, sensor kinase
MTERGHEYTVTIPAPALFVNADAARLHQMLMNLLANAEWWSHPPCGCRSETDVAIRVRGAGQGIEPVILPPIFDLFTR